MQARMRRLSQAISEGDGISLIAPAPDAESALAAERGGAEGVVLDHDLPGVREATGLPILLRLDASPSDALNRGADALLMPASALDDDADWVERRWREAHELGLECVVEVRDADELELAMERLDPEIFLLSPQESGNDDDPLDNVLDLLADVPAGKLAIADLAVTTQDEIAELERAGVDAVIVASQNLAGLVRAAPPEV
jgi:indole-3-glycerol phosphate synthase